MGEYEAEKEDSEIELPAIFIGDTSTSNTILLYEPTVSPLNESKIDFRILFDEFDDDDYTVIFDENSFSYKIISVNNLKTDSENDNEKVNIPLPPSPEPEVSYSNDLDFFKNFENEFPAIVYNDALTSNNLLETSHDKLFNTETFIKKLNVNIMTYNHLTNGMSFIFLIMNLYVSFGIPFDAKLLYKDGIKLGQL
ncbi:hypothetical protein Tco_0921844 [Tanacetum coccineum]